MADVAGAKRGGLAGPGIGSYDEVEQVLPSDYRPLLTPRETQVAIHGVKRYIEDGLCRELNLAMVTEHQQGQQIAGIINLLFIFPFFFFILVFTDPNSPLMVAMTLFPTSAFMTVAMRWGVTTIPAWQLVLGWVLLVASASFMIVVAARVFRIGMLQYGQPLSLRAVAEIARAPGA